MAEQGDEMVVGGSPTWHILEALGPESTVPWGNKVAERTAAAALKLGLTPQSAELVRLALAQAIGDGMPGSSQGRSSCKQVRIHVLCRDPDAERRSCAFGTAIPAGQAPGRNWGFFLVTKPAGIGGDEATASEFAVELFLYPEGSEDAGLPEVP
jgi:hypothetical protein